MKIQYFKPFLICITLLCFCLIANTLLAQKKKVPLWMKNPSKVFDEAVYMFAKGEGNSDKIAMDEALQNLSTMISSEVKSEFTSQVSEIINDTGLGNVKDAAITQLFTSKGSIKSENTLFNIKYSSYSIPKKELYYAIAYINKNETIEICKSSIQQNNEEINSLLSMDISLLRKYKLLKDLLSVAAKNEQLLTLLTVLDPVLSRNTDVFRYHILNEEIEKLSAQITFKIDAPNDNKLKSQFENLITDLEYNLSDNPLYILKCELRFNEQNRLENLITVNWNLDVKLYYNEQLEASYYIHGLKDHYTSEEAMQVIYRKLSSKLCLNPEFRKDFFGK